MMKFSIIDKYINNTFVTNIIHDISCDIFCYTKIFFDGFI